LQPSIGELSHPVYANQSGTIVKIDNRKLAKVAKLSGAPGNKGAGILFLAPLGKVVKQGELIFTIYAESKGELAYALEYLKSESEIIKIDPV